MRTTRQPLAQFLRERLRCSAVYQGQNEKDEQPKGATNHDQMEDRAFDAGVSRLLATNSAASRLDATGRRASRTEGGDYVNGAAPKASGIEVADQVGFDAHRFQHFQYELDVFVTSSPILGDFGVGGINDVKMSHATKVTQKRAKRKWCDKSMKRRNNPISSNQLEVRPGGAWAFEETVG